MMMTRLITGMSLIAGAFVFAGSASASCGSGMYCTQNSHTTSGYGMLRQVNPIATSSAVSYSSAPVAIADQPAVQYASANTSKFHFVNGATGASSASMPGTGPGERLVRVNCPVSVDAPAGSKVLDCYTIEKTQYVQPAPVTRAYQVVRPVIYVRYPVPVMVPNACGPIYDAPSRYGSSYGYGRCGQ
jgi:hypothetical protein